jgi:hypothetical protein
VVAKVAKVETLVAALIAAEAEVDEAAEGFRAVLPPMTMRYPQNGGLSNLRVRRERYLNMQRAIADVGPDNVLGEPEYRTVGGLSQLERRLLDAAMPRRRRRPGTAGCGVERVTT